MFLQLFIEAAMAVDEAAPGFTLAEIWEHSGFIARSVIVLLGVMFVGTVFVGIERQVAFMRGRSRSMQLAGEVTKPMEQGNLDKALKITQDEQYKPAYLRGLLAAGLKEMSERTDEVGLKSAERAVAKAITEEQGRLRRGMGILATVGSTAPFVGLFGTTFGVINAFQQMSQNGAGLESISAGISEALITTGVGIGVAVVGVWFFNYCNGRIEKIVEELYGSETDFIDWAHKLLADRADATDPGVTTAAGAK